MNITRPPRLQKGDVIGVVSPASTIADTTRIDRGVAYLEKLGYRVRLGSAITRVHGYLAGTDEERATDLNTMFGDPQVKAIFCVRGGYGSPRLLRLLDYRAIRRNPKIFMGFSDVTALQLALFKKCGLVTFHGPMLGVDMAGDINPYAEEFFWRLLTSVKGAGTMTFPPDTRVETLRPGKASGILLGGNLSLIASQVGTLYLPDFTRALLFMEDVGEEPYRVDRMLMQLLNAGILTRVDAIMAGQFSDSMPKDSSTPSLTMEQVFKDIVDITQKPFLSNLPFGHISAKMTIPQGIRARIDAGAGTVTILEATVE